MISQNTPSYIGNGSNQIILDNLKKTSQLHIENGTGRFTILKNEWQ